MSAPLADSTTDKGYRLYQTKRREFWNRLARRGAKPAASRYYHRRLAEIYRFLVPAGQRVLELGSGSGDLLAAVAPSRGLGIDFADEAVANSQNNHPGLEFRCADVHELDLDEKFDVVILSDLVNDIWDVETVLRKISSFCTPETRIIINSFNRMWQAPIALGRAARLIAPVLKQNWLSRQDISNLLRIADLEPISTFGEILWPARTPLIDAFFNKFLVKFWPFNRVALTMFFVARPDPTRSGKASKEPSVSVIVPARNEAGHIEAILERTPNMGSRTELIFVEGNSTDDTFDVIRRAVVERDDPDIRFYQQPGRGKGDAVRFGFGHATGDILMILDADMTVAPEDLPRFYQAIAEGKGEFINGVRLVYPMEEEAMQFLNYLGNKFFGMTFSWLLSQPVKDTLCGTKVLTRKSYDVIAGNRSYFGDFDPFGDFDLLFGAAKVNLKILDMPIRYREREYGSTNIDRWRHGVVLLKMAAVALRRLKLI
jgi:2-polyprenyl-3-methyl-5-hydroxy-6-metoxy-1,4-benzoquinol methylase